MTTGTGSSRTRRRRFLLIGAAVLVVVLAATAVLVVRAIPAYRTTLLVDTSVGAGGDDFAAVAGAVSAAAQNSADGDALALRRFGGACDSAGNTEQVVEVGTGQARKIGDAARALTPGGQPTLLDGILAAIDDFARPYPFRGSEGNRIIVVSRHGVDGCNADHAAVAATIRERVEDAGLTLDFRFVGFQVPAEQRPVLTQVATATGAPEPVFPENATDLTSVLVRFTIPESPDAAPVAIPTPDPTADWTPYRNAQNGYSLRYPPNWLVEECETQVWLAHIRDLLPGCLGTDFFFYLVQIRVDAADQAYTGPYDEDTYDKIEIRDVTVDGVAGKRHSAIVAKEPPVGTDSPGDMVVRYVLPANGRVYTIYYRNNPSSAGATKLLEEFDLLITKTLTFEG
ncbi:vWA domain-containing protein [Plantactinospora endophytica]|uniref:VWA domain-containing protein n=1 Tax=Plantactinospora endophytica TaxID=673535 RepID=A0ABQ4EDB8_9ACTN|nr:hypothetical protein [Plantactinospora endophytica]GIG92718.1 hypothetical protein Pen02_76540 [Plantactinospora endophytica]